MMLMIRGIIILHLVSVCIAANTTKKISFETGNKLAVLRFEGDGVSDPLIEHLTEELRQSIRDLKIFNVQNQDITNDVHIFYPRSKDYWACWKKECAVDIGRQLRVNYVIAGNIQKKEKPLEKKFLTTKLLHLNLLIWQLKLKQYDCYV